MLRNDAKTCEKLGGQLGGHLTSRGLKAYKITGGTLSWIHGRPQWVPPHCSMVFDVKGEMYDGLVRYHLIKKKKKKKKSKYKKHILVVPK